MAVQAAQQVKSAAPAKAKAQPQQAPGTKEAPASPKATAQFNQSVAKNAPAQKPASAKASPAKLGSPNPVPSNLITAMRYDNTVLNKAASDVAAAKDKVKAVQNTGGELAASHLEKVKAAQAAQASAEGVQTAERQKSDGDVTAILNAVGTNHDGYMFKPQSFYDSQLNPAFEQAGVTDPSSEFRQKMTAQLNTRTEQGLVGRIVADSDAQIADRKGLPPARTSDDIEAESNAGVQIEKINARPVLGPDANAANVDADMFKQVRERVASRDPVTQQKIKIQNDNVLTNSQKDTLVYDLGLEGGPGAAQTIEGNDIYANTWQG